MESVGGGGSVGLLGAFATVTAEAARAKPANDCARRPPDRAAALYRAHHTAIFVRCRRLLKDHQAAEDATQETFIRVARHIDKAPPGPDALRWMYRIATNYCLNEIRNRQLAAQPMSELPERAHGNARSEENALSDRDLVRRILTSVPEKLRVVAVLRHMNGLCDHEVAAVMGIARRTVIYRLGKFKQHAHRLDA